MGKYITKRCGNCKSLITNMETTSGTRFGSPITNCPHCGALQIDREYKEYIMLNPIDYFRLFAGVTCVGLILGFLLDLLVFFGILHYETLSNPLFTWISVIVAIVLHYKNSFLKDKKASIERLKNKKYLKQLLEYKLISQKQFDDFIDKYY